MEMRTGWKCNVLISALLHRGMSIGRGPRFKNKPRFYGITLGPKGHCY